MYSRSKSEEKYTGGPSYQVFLAKNPSLLKKNSPSPSPIESGQKSPFKLKMDSSPAQNKAISWIKKEFDEDRKI
jgi:hypothetical protein